MAVPTHLWWLYTALGQLCISFPHDFFRLFQLWAWRGPLTKPDNSVQPFAGSQSLSHKIQQKIARQQSPAQPDWARSLLLCRLAPASDWPQVPGFSLTTQGQSHYPFAEGFKQAAVPDWLLSPSRLLAQDSATQASLSPQPKRKSYLSLGVFPDHSSCSLFLLPLWRLSPSLAGFDQQWGLTPLQVQPARLIGLSGHLNTLSLVWHPHQIPSPSRLHPDQC